MSFFSNLGLKGKLLIIACPLVSLIITFVIVLDFINAKKGFSGISKRVTILSSEIEKKQKDSLGVVQAELADANSALKTKGEGFTKLIGGIAGTAVATFDIPTLDAMVSAASNDQDVLFCYIENETGKALSTYTNSQDNELKKLIGDVPSTVTDVLGRLKGINSVLEVESPVLLDGTKLGIVRLYLLLNLDAGKKIQKSFDDFNSSTKNLFEGLVLNIAEDVKKQAHNGIILGIILVVSGVLVFLIVLSALLTKIVRPIANAANLMKDIAEGDGDLTMRIVAETSDEIGALANGFNTFTEKVHGIVKQISEGTQTLAVSAEELSHTSSELASSAQEMSLQTQTVASNTEQTSVNITNISETAKEMSKNVSLVATAIDAMNASLNEVANNCQRESKMTAKAEDLVRGTKAVMQALGEEALAVGNVVQIISEIADRTGLLALNATIEAALAGEKGKGFSIVANEVKELSRQTTEATSKIRNQIKMMQKHADGAVSSIENISMIIEEINTVSQSIVTSVEEQSDTVNDIARTIGDADSAASEIARNVSESAQGLTLVSSNIAMVNCGASDIANGAASLTNCSNELSQLAANLGAIVRQFKI